jgi:hypothetical protein
MKGVNAASGAVTLAPVRVLLTDHVKFWILDFEYWTGRIAFFFRKSAAAGCGRSV